MRQGFGKQSMLSIRGVQHGINPAELEEVEGKAWGREGYAHSEWLPVQEERGTRHVPRGFMGSIPRGSSEGLHSYDASDSWQKTEFRRHHRFLQQSNLIRLSTLSTGRPRVLPGKTFRSHCRQLRRGREVSWRRGWRAAWSLEADGAQLCCGLSQTGGSMGCPSIE